MLVMNLSVIPHIVAKDVPQLINHMPSASNYTNYVGIFGRTKSENVFVLKENGVRNWCQSFKSVNDSSVHCTDYIYCGKKYGIIMSRFDGLRQLKLNQITDKKTM